MDKSAESFDATIEKITRKVSDLEKDDETKKREWQNDLPRRGNVKITYRPRVERNSEDEADEDSMDAIAANTLAAMQKK